MEHQMGEHKTIEREYTCCICGIKFVSLSRCNKPSVACCGYECYQIRDKIRRDRKDKLNGTENGLNVLYECKCISQDKVYHHPNYQKPKEVIKLCHSCHKLEHSRLRTLTKKRESFPYSSEEFKYLGAAPSQTLATQMSANETNTL